MAFVLRILDAGARHPAGGHVVHPEGDVLPARVLVAEVPEALERLPVHRALDLLADEAAAEDRRERGRAGGGLLRAGLHVLARQLEVVRAGQRGEALVLVADLAELLERLLHLLGARDLVVRERATGGEPDAARHDQGSHDPSIAHDALLIRLPAPGRRVSRRKADDRVDDAGIPLDDVGLRRPTLDDVFLSLTGHSAEEMPIDTENGSTPVPAGRTS